MTFIGFLTWTKNKNINNCEYFSKNHENRKYTCNPSFLSKDFPRELKRKKVTALDIKEDKNRQGSDFVRK